MSIPQTAIAVQSVLFLIAAVVLAFVADGSADPPIYIAYGCAVWSAAGQAVMVYLIVLDARTRESETKIEAAEAERKARATPSVPVS